MVELGVLILLEAGRALRRLRAAVQHLVHLLLDLFLFGVCHGVPLRLAAERRVSCTLNSTQGHSGREGRVAGGAASTVAAGARSVAADGFRRCREAQFSSLS